MKSYPTAWAEKKILDQSAHLGIFISLFCLHINSLKVQIKEEGEKRWVNFF